MRRVWNTGGLRRLWRLPDQQIDNYIYLYTAAAHRAYKKRIITGDDRTDMWVAYSAEHAEIMIPEPHTATACAMVTVTEGIQ